MNGPYKSAEHCWGTPMPGQGRDQICIRCGSRRSVAAEQCPGQEIETFSSEVTQHDYNPLEADD
jgi:hypothetical protein